MKFKRLFSFLVLGVLFGCQYHVFELPVACDTLALTLSAKTDANCSQSNGSITVAATGGTGEYTFTIQSGASQSSNVFQGLSAGSYQIVVKDHTCSASVTVEITNKDGFNFTATTANATCGTSSGSLTVSPTGGTSPFTYSVNGGAFTTATTYSGLSHGNYTVIAKDASGCAVTKSVKVLTGVSFASTISPIISNNCAISGCHNGSRSPDLRTLKNIQSNAASIKAQTGSRSMPQGGTLTQAQIDAIACWVDDGAQDN